MYPWKSKRKLLKLVCHNLNLNLNKTFLRKLDIQLENICESVIFCKSQNTLTKAGLKKKERDSITFELQSTQKWAKNLYYKTSLNVNSFLFSSMKVSILSSVKYFLSLVDLNYSKPIKMLLRLFQAIIFMLDTPKEQQLTCLEPA